MVSKLPEGRVTRSDIEKALAQSREKLGESLAQKSDPKILGDSGEWKDKAIESIQKKPLVWGLGALLAGLLLQRLFFPGRRHYAPARGGSLLAWMLGFLGKSFFTISKPALTKIAQEKLSRFTK